MPQNRAAWIRKYDPLGNIVWNAAKDSTGDDACFGLATDSNKNVYATGRVAGSVNGETYYGQYDLFIVKFDAGGNEQFYRQHGVSGGLSESGNKIHVTSGGRIMVVAFVESDLHVPPGTHPDPGSNACMVIEYDINGLPVWARFAPEGQPGA